MRVGVVDIGSNSTRLLLADVAGDGAVHELERRSIVTRLGQGVDASGRLAEEAMDRVREVLAGYAAALDEHGAQRRVAVLTSAVRDAANGAEFLAEVRERFGLTVLLVEHHMNMVMRVSDKVVALDFGRKIADGTPDAVRTNPDVMRAYLGENV